MAKPGELAELVARMFGAEAPTVRQQARELRDAGYMAKEKGGRGAGSMSTRDAANLLLAAASTTSIRKSVRAVERPGGFVSHSRKWKLGFASIPELKALPDDHTLVDAVVALIDAGVSGTLQETADQSEGRAVDLQHDLHPDLYVDVKLSGPWPSASISIGVLTRDENGSPDIDPDAVETHVYNKLTLQGQGNLSGFVLPISGERDIDLTTEFQFSLRTIIAVANLLRN